MGTRREHKGRLVQDYMFGHADQPVSVHRVAEEVGWAASSVSSALSSMLKKYPQQMERTSKGFYRWNSTPIVKVPEEPREVTEMMVSILVRKDDGTLLVLDQETKGELYLMRPFTF